MENRVAALESILRQANINVPDNFGRAIIESINTARAAVEGTLLPDADEPDNDQLFHEMLNILENGNDDEKNEGGPSSG